jgi:preprotein translocase subunit SecF
MGSAKTSFAVFGLAALVAVGSLAIRGLSSSIDFTGGRNFTVKFEQQVVPEDVEAVLAKVDNIYNSIEHILSESKATGEPEGVIATRYAESLIYK